MPEQTEQETTKQNDQINEPATPDAEIYTSDQQDREAKSSEVFTISSSNLTTAIVALVFLGVGVLLGMNLNTGSGDSIDRQALAAIVQQAVAEAMEAPDETSAMAGDSPFLGPEDAVVTIVEFSDFLCSFCGRHFENTLTPIIENYGDHVRYVYRDFPGVGGERAVTSALASHCAADQDRFWDYHAMLFGNQSDLFSANTPTALERVLIDYAEGLDLEIDTFTECLESRRHMTRIIQSSSDAQSIGARGTPAFLVNGTFVSGAQDYQVFANLIESELAKAGVELDDEEFAG